MRGGSSLKPPALPLSSWAGLSVLALACATSCGCSQGGADDPSTAHPQPLASPPPSNHTTPAPVHPEQDGEERVLVHISSTDDLQAAIDRHQALAYESDDTHPATLELALAPGTYERAHLTLTTDENLARPVSITLRGPDDGVATLVQPRLALAGPRVALRDLVIEGSASSLGVKLEASEAIEVERVALLDQRARPPARSGTRVPQGAMWLSAKAPEVRAELRDLWIARSRGARDAPLVRVAGASGHRFGDVTFERVGFAAIEALPALGLYSGRATFTECHWLGEGDGELIVVGPEAQDAGDTAWRERPQALSEQGLEEIIEAIRRGQQPRPPHGW
jgi:hypothetical protein